MQMSSTSSILCQISVSDRKPLAIVQNVLYQKSNSCPSSSALCPQALSAFRFSHFAFRLRPLDFCQIYWKSHNSPSYHSFCTRGQNLTGCTPSTSQFGLGANPHAPNSPTFFPNRAPETPETRTFPTNPGRNPCWEFSPECGNLTTRARRGGGREGRRRAGGERKASSRRRACEQRAGCGRQV